MGFDPGWVDSLMKCVSTVSYSVRLNDNVGDNFRSTRGLRQGDPLSPFLFLICREGLSSLMRLAMNGNILRVVKVSRSGSQISHLLFADDCILFGEASERGAQSLKRILLEYENYCSQCVNYGKSTIFFSTNTHKGDKRTVFRILGVRSSNEPEKYIGLPNMAFLQNSGGRKVKIKEEIYLRLPGRASGQQKGYCRMDYAGGLVRGSVFLFGVTYGSSVLKLIDYRMSTFNADVVKKILQIPLAEIAYEDFQVWRGESSGEFSIRSAYKLLQEANLGPSNNYLQAETRDFYRKLWSLHIPPKIKTTNWRISWNYIPTLSNLKTKKVVSAAICPRCQHPEEDSNHIFRYCPIAIDVWSNLNLD
ncbi:hypothetical protein CXB51_033829 [Gossypium anomalum]|uniref:Reverse transcriptase domain-containing protein n=1 Tax=Gossypium anomalum TaxID=47600 RepID=A0A8J5XQI9_9ROSI|nr:hypothetical protein CXB51_033829 [Gossypium anomalum]